MGHAESGNNFLGVLFPPNWSTSAGVCIGSSVDRELRGQSRIERPQIWRFERVGQKCFERAKQQLLERCWEGKRSRKVWALLKILRIARGPLAGCIVSLQDATRRNYE